jgi:transcriptional regulator with XRE-family HTH domain
MSDYSRDRVAQNLKKMRRDAGYRSARAFAEHIGINVHTYTNFEQGTSPISLARACQISEGLGCTIDELCGRQMPEPNYGHIPNIVVRAYEESNEAGRFMLENQAKMILNTPEFSQGGAQPRVREDKAI